MIWSSAWFLASGGSGGWACWVWWSGYGLAFICLEPQCGKVNCTYGGGEKTLDQTWRCHCIGDFLLAYCLKISPAKNHALYCSILHSGLQLTPTTMTILLTQRSVLRATHIEFSRHVKTQNIQNMLEASIHTHILNHSVLRVTSTSDIF